MPVEAFVLVLIACICFTLSTPSEEQEFDLFELHDTHKNVTTRMLRNEATRWYQEFNRMVIGLKSSSPLKEEDQERLYNLWRTGVVYNLWIGLPNIEAYFIMAYRMISDNLRIFNRMKLKRPADLNPFRRYCADTTSPPNPILII